MSKSVDEKVVSMRFDNSGFEKNVNTTMSSLDKLKQKLHFDGATKGLENISSAAKKIDMSQMSDSIDSVKLKFSALEVMAVTALANITNSVVNAGKNFVKSLTLDPIISGFQEYETQMNAVQTIMANTASKGTTLQQVNDALDELNLYADLTIYNFTEMTRNIGTFTAAGVDLKTSVSAIQGIANLAAVSGSTSQQASTAMYQLSQALAAGTVKLMDWNSVVNAGMGGEVFQNALKETSRLLGTGADAAIAAEGSFRESLSTGWLTSQVLTETLKKFTESGAIEYVASYCGVSEEAVQAELDLAKTQYGEAEAIEYASQALAEKTGKSKDEIKATLEMAKTATEAATKVKTFTQLLDTLKEAAQSGWASTWRTIIGDFEEAKKLFTEISNFASNLIGQSANARNAVLEQALGLRWNDFTKEVEAAGISVNDFQAKLTEVASSNGIALDKLIKEHGDLNTVVAKGLISEDIFRQTIKSMAGDSTALSAALEDTNSSVNTLLKSISKPTGREMLIDTLRNGAKALLKLFEALKKGWEMVFPPKSTEEKASGLYKIIEGIHRFSQALILSEDKIEKLAQTVAGILSPLGLLWDIISSIGKSIFEAFFNLGGAFDGAQGGILSVTAAFGKFIKHIVDFIRYSHTLNAILTAIRVVLTGVTWAISHVVQKIKDFVHQSELMNLVALAGAQLFELIKEKAHEYLEKLKDGLRYVKEMIQNSERLQTAIKALKNAFQNGKSFVKDWVEKLKEAENIPQYLIEGLANGLKTYIPKIIEIGKALAESIIQSVKGMLGIHSPSTVFEQIGINIGQGLINGIKDIGGDVINSFYQLIKNILDSIKKIDLGTIFSGVMAGSLIISIQKISDAILNFSKPFASVGKMFDSVNKVMNSISNAINTLGKAAALNLKAVAIKNIAIAIAILAASLIALTFVDPDKLWNAVKVIGALAAILAVLIVLTGELQKVSINLSKSGASIKKSSSLLLVLTAAILMMAISVKLLGGLELGQAIQGVAMLAAFLVAFYVVIKQYDKIATDAERAKGFGDIGPSLLKIAAAILIMAVIVRLLGGMNVGKMMQGVLAIELLALIMVELMAATRLIQTGDFGNLGRTLLAVSGAIAILAVVVRLLGTMDSSALEKGIFAVSRLALIISGLMLITRVANSGDIGNLGVTLLGVAAGIALMAVAVWLLGNMSVESLTKGMVCVSIFSAIMIALMISVREIGGTTGGLKIAAAIVAIGVAIALMSAAMLILSFIPWEGLVKGIVALGALSVFVALLIASARAVQAEKASIIALAVVVGVLAATVIILSFIDPSKLVGPIIAMTMLMGMFALIEFMCKKIDSSIAKILLLAGIVAMLAGIIYILGNVDPGSAIASAAGISLMLISMTVALRILENITFQVFAGIAAIAVLSIVVLGLAGIIYLLRDINPQSAIAAAVGLSTLLLAMSAACLILMAVGVIIGATGGIAALGLAAIAALGIVVLGLAGIIILLQDLDPEKGTAIATMLSNFLMELTKACLLLSVLGALGVLAIAGAWSMIAVVTTLGAFLAAIGGLVTLFPQLEEFIDKGIPILEKIGYAIGSFFGNIIAGFSTAIADSLPKVGESLSKFMTNLQPFFDGIKMVDESMLNNVNILKDIILAISGAGILDALGSAFTGQNNIETIGEQLKTFGQKMVEFSNIVAGINQDAVTAAASAGKMFSEMLNNLPKEGGYFDKVQKFWNGSFNMESFGTFMRNFAETMVDVSNAVSGEGSINEAAIQSVANCGKSFGELLTSLANIEVGENAFTLHSFGGEIQSFVNTLTEVSKTLTSSDNQFNPDAINKATECGKALAELAKTVPDSNQIAAGEQDLGAFAHQIETYGMGIAQLSKKLAEEGALKPDGIKTAVECGKWLNELAKTLPDSGMWQIVSGGKDLGTFAHQIETYGMGLAELSKKLSEEGAFDPGKIKEAAECGKPLAELANSIPDSGFGVNFGGRKSLDDFGSQIKLFGEHLKKFQDATWELNIGHLTAIVDFIKEMMTNLSEFGEFNTEGMTSFADFVNNTLVNLGWKLKDFQDVTWEIDTGHLNAMFSFISSASSLGNFGEFNSEGISSFADFVSNTLVNLGWKLKDFQDATWELDLGHLTAILNFVQEASMKLSTVSFVDPAAVQSLVDSINSLGTISIQSVSDNINGNIENVCGSLQSMINSMAETLYAGKGLLQSAGCDMAWGVPDGINEVAGGAAEAGANLVNSAEQGIGDTYGRFKTPGNWAAWGFIDGIYEQVGACAAAGKALGDAAAGGIGDTYFRFKTSGNYAAWGFKDGILEKAGEAAEAAAKMVTDAKNAAKNAQGEASPAKEFIKSGKYASMGYAIGIEKYSYLSAQASEEMVLNSMDAVSQTLSKVEDNNIIEIQPKISPVLDMDEVNTVSVDLTGNLNSLFIKPVTSMSSLMTTAQDETIKSNNQVIEAIDEFRKDFGTLLESDADQEVSLYVDGKKLASSIAKPMDRQLSILAKRGEY